MAEFKPQWGQGIKQERCMVKSTSTRRKIARQKLRRPLKFEFLINNKYVIVLLKKTHSSFI